jgi:hypothetical protein
MIFNSIWTREQRSHLFQRNICHFMAYAIGLPQVFIIAIDGFKTR